MAKSKSSKVNSGGSFLNNIESFIFSNKLLTGLMMLSINIISKYATIELSDTQQEYLNNTIVRHVILFLILFSSTKDLVISIILLTAFIIMANYLFNDKSSFCVLKKSTSCKEKPVSQKEIKQAIKTLKRAKGEYVGNLTNQIKI